MFGLLGFWNSKKLIIGVVLAIALGIYIASLHAQLGYTRASLKKEKVYNAQLESEIEDLKRKNDDWRIALDTTKKLTDKCNESIDILEKRIKEAKNKAAEAIKNAEAISLYRQAQINEANKRPRNESGTCALSVEHAKSDLGG